MRRLDLSPGLRAWVHALGLVAAGCVAAPEPAPSPGAAFLFPGVAHAGHNGVHTFQVPFTTGLTGDVAWSVADPAVATITEVTPPAELAEFSPAWAIVTTRGVGRTTISATVGDLRVDAELVVAAYTPAQVDAGQTRYDDPSATGREVSCASCHRAAGGADHSPVSVAVYDDAEVLALVTTGRYTGTDSGLGLDHAWQLSPSARDGIVPYLRSLPPRGF